MRMSQVLQQLQREQSATRRRPRLMERYADFLPLTAETPPLGLGEGFTPLVHARSLGRAIGVPLLYLKVEGQNPTGSFKDRGMVVAVAKAMEAGAGPSSAPPPATPRPRRRPTGRRPASRSWSSCRAARSPPASCCRRRRPAHAWWPWRATSTTPCASSAS